MPCDQVRIVTVEIDAPDLEVLQRGLERAGYSVERFGGIMYIYRNGYQEAYLRDGKLNINVDGSKSRQAQDLQQERIINGIKSAYSVGIVYEMASQQGWQVEEVFDEQTNGRTFHVIKEDSY